MGDYSGGRMSSSPSNTTLHPHNTTLSTIGDDLQGGGRWIAWSSASNVFPDELLHQRRRRAAGEARSTAAAGPCWISPERCCPLSPARPTHGHYFASTLAVIGFVSSGTSIYDRGDEPVLRHTAARLALA